MRNEAPQNINSYERNQMIKQIEEHPIKTINKEPFRTSQTTSPITRYTMLHFVTERYQHKETKTTN